MNINRVVLWVFIPLVALYRGASAEDIVASFNASVTLGIAPLPVLFTDTSNVPTGVTAQYIWSFGDGTVGQGRNLTHIYEDPGIYTVQLAVHIGTDIYTVTRQSLITVLELTPGFDGSPRTGPSPRTIQFENLSVTSGLSTSYRWDFGDGTTSGAFAPSHRYQEEGVYTVSLRTTTSLGVRTETKRAFIILGYPDNSRSHVVTFMDNALEPEFGSSSPSPRLAIQISSQFRTSGVIARHQTGTFTNFDLEPQQVKSFAFPTSAVIRGSDVTLLRGIDVFGENPIQVFGTVMDTLSADGFTTLSYDTLGLRYRVMSHPAYAELVDQEDPDLGFSFYRASQFAVVATANQTTLRITPSVTVASYEVDEPFEINLNRSQVYQLQTDSAEADLTGTLIESNRPVAVFSGHEAARVRADFSDHLIEQVPPVPAWGLEYIAMPSASRLQGDTIRILADESGTNVSVGAAGTGQFTLGAGQFADRVITVPTRISANKPILVAVFASGSRIDAPTDDDESLGDPYMTVLPPTDRFAREYSFVTPLNSAFLEYDNFLNLVALTLDVDNNNVVIDGQSIDPGLFTPVPGSIYSSAQFILPHGSHNVLALNPVGAYAYGFAPFESYGFPAGMKQGGLEPVTDDRTPAEVATEFRLTIHAVDLDGDRRISAFEAIGAGVLGDLFDELDLDGDGFISMEELLSLTVGTPGVQPVVYVDFTRESLGKGTLADPFNTFLEAQAYVQSIGTVVTLGGDSSETFAGKGKLTKTMIVMQGNNKLSTIGVPAPAP